MSREHFSWKMLLGSIVMGAVYGIIGEAFYQSIGRQFPPIVVVSLYFTGLFVWLGAAVYLIGKAGRHRSYSPVNKKQWMVAFLLFILLSVLFEYIYELIGPWEKRSDFSCYLFVIDNSGSMEDTDPKRMRYQAIDKLLENKKSDFEYAVYCFADSAELVREMAPVSEGQFDWEGFNDGKTAVYHSLATILMDIEDGRLKIQEGCRMILLSDGYATDIDDTNRFEWIRLLEKFAQKGISISSVGMPGSDEELLMLVADKTGGVYIGVENVEQLEQGMRQAAEINQEDRELLGYRSGSYANLLLGFLRIVFVACLGMVIAVEKTILCERFLNTNSVLLSSAAGSVLAGICIEIGMNTLGMAPSVMRILTCVLIAFTLLHEDVISEGQKDSSVLKG